MLNLSSEFASVLVSLDTDGNGPRLRVQDRRTGRVAFFDPLELECLAWADQEDLARMADPGRTRWVTDDASAEDDDVPDVAGDSVVHLGDASSRGERRRS